MLEKLPVADSKPEISYSDTRGKTRIVKTAAYPGSLAS
jgi:hypothetical protein